MIVLQPFLERLHPNEPPISGGGTTGISGVVGGTVTNNNSDVGVSITTNIKWTFAHAIDQDDVDLIHFTVTKTSDGDVVTGTVTIDDTKKIVTFIPIDVTANTEYIATANAVRLLDGSGSTTPMSVDFTTL